MEVGFSYVGLIWLLLLYVPNIIYLKNKPAGIEKLGAEDRVLRVLEMTGQVGITMIAPISKNLNPTGISPWTLWLLASAACMALYEVFWARYFRGEKTLESFYAPLFGIPVPGAVLPVAGLGLLAVFGKTPQLMLFVIALGIGHIKIHLRHKKEISDMKEE